MGSGRGRGRQTGEERPGPGHRGLRLPQSALLTVAALHCLVGLWLALQKPPSVARQVFLVSPVQTLGHSGANEFYLINEE